MFNYLGSGVGPGTMPAAVPGAGQLADTMGAIKGRAPVPPNIAQAMQPAHGAPPIGAGLMPPAPSPDDPSSMKYAAVTQQDGTVLLHIQNPDGSLGPAVKIINAVKPSSVTK